MEPVGVLELVQELHAGKRRGFRAHYSLNLLDTL